MKRASYLILVITLFFLNPVIAAEVTVAEKTEIKLNPTLEFISALATCNDGEYKQKNVLEEIVGDVYLMHRIKGVDYDICRAILTTPDKRELECEFDIVDLRKLNDRHFIKGILTQTAIKPNEGAVEAELLWSDLKRENCRLRTEAEVLADMLGLSEG